MKNKANFLTQSALIAALYVVLTMISSAFGMSSGVIQIRLGEALTVLPYFTPAAIPGLFIGCIISNIFSQAIIWDVVFGSLATLVGALGTYFLRKRNYVLAVVPPIAANTITVPFILAYAYNIGTAIPFMILTVGMGEILSCGVLGILLIKALKKRSKNIFR